MQRAKQICRQHGCNRLIDAPGYCDTHNTTGSSRFAELQRAPGSSRFYGGAAWKRVRAAYRRDNPLCEQCKRLGIISIGRVIDHIVERNDLIARGDSPYDPAFLQNLCTSCNMAKLRARKK